MHVFKSPRLILVTALALGWLADLFFYGKALGVSMLLFVLVLLAALVGLGRHEGIYPLRRQIWLGLPLIFFSAMVAVRANAFITFLNVVASLALLGLIAHFYTAGRLVRLGLLGYPLVLLETGINALIRPAPLIAASADVETLRSTGKRNVLPIICGLVLAVPVLTIFICFLAAADLVFASYVEYILDLDFLADILEGLWRGALIVVVAWLLAGGLAYTYSRRAVGAGESIGEIATRRLGAIQIFGFVEAAMVLVAVDLLFLVFVAIQFTYLFGGQANIVLEGYTYAEYARRGFFELVAVSLLALGLILGLHRLGRRRTPAQIRPLNGLSSLMIGLVLVILASAFQRLLLYEAAFGYTQLRLYSHIFMVWLAITFVWLLVTLWWQPGYFAIGAFAASLCFLITLNFVNPDAFIARQNLARYQTSGKLDAYYLTSLSDDAIPVLASSLGQLRQSERDVIMNNLSFRRSQLDQRFSEQPWVSFNQARWRAHRAVVGLPLD